MIAALLIVYVFGVYLAWVSSEAGTTHGVAMRALLSFGWPMFALQWLIKLVKKTK